MAVKHKGAAESKDAAEASKQPQNPTPAAAAATVYERAKQVYDLTHSFEEAIVKDGLIGLSEADRNAYLSTLFIRKRDGLKGLPQKVQAEIRKSSEKANVPLVETKKPAIEDWGKDRHGRNIGEYLVEPHYRERLERQARLQSLETQSEVFRQRRHMALKLRDEAKAFDKDTMEEERKRRLAMAQLKQELYGDRVNPYALDPDWDDVLPIAQMEPVNAPASIAYADDYAESMSYLRAVMAAQEYSPRCLKLTEHIIELNPSHYTVWLYRFSIVEHLDLPLMEELEWLNKVSLEHPKNYQIWHHRHMLTERLYPSIADNADEIKTFAQSNRDFMTTMLEADAKNYHVWSFRQYLVRKLGMWGEEEMGSIETLIDKDVRNNSAWSHRFFLVFANPAQSTADCHPTEHDPAVPADMIDGEIDYARGKIELEPQNQSPWNYLRGVLAKGGRKLGSVRAFTEGYVTALGESDEAVRSSHALDLLADMYEEAGDMDRASLALTRLAEKWDRIRWGYWTWKRDSLGTGRD